jgi:hypothetical protein
MWHIIEPIIPLIMKKQKTAITIGNIHQSENPKCSVPNI